MITPLSQALTVAYASSLLKKDGGFKEAVEKVFRENYKNDEEAFAALKEFWVGNRSFRALFSVFLSRGRWPLRCTGKARTASLWWTSR